MIDKEKLMNYIQNNFNIDTVSYMLIDNIIDIFKNNIDKIIEILNNCRIDITKKELKENKIMNNKEVGK